MLDALQRGHESALFLDSDVIVRDRAFTRTALLQQYTTCSSAVTGCGDVFFGGNAPFWGRGNWRLPTCAPPNTAVIFARNTPLARAALRTWWDAPAGEWAFNHSWEQRALWSLWPTSPELVAAFRLLARGGSCLRTMFAFPPLPARFSLSAVTQAQLRLPDGFSPEGVRATPLVHLDSASICRTPGKSTVKCARRRRSLLLALADPAGADQVNLSRVPSVTVVDGRRVRLDRTLPKVTARVRSARRARGTTT